MGDCMNFVRVNRNELHKDSIVLIPAYGRIYNDDCDMITSFMDGKDFKIVCGPYCSIADFEGDLLFDVVFFNPMTDHLLRISHRIEGIYPYDYI